MNATIIARSPGGPDVLELVDRPLPEPGPGQLRVRVQASTVNPIDLSHRAGRLASAGLTAPSDTIELGWDVAGRVDAVGAGVRSFAVGDAVIGLRDLLFAPGAHAEHVVLDETALAPAPPGLPPELAAALPLNGLTAARSLDLAAVPAGGTLLVTGAGGGVGGFALELAALRGLRTVALARPGQEDLVGGAEHVVTSAEGLGAAVRRLVPGGVDAVVDAAVLGIVAHDALRGGGTFVALVAPFAPPPIRGTRVVVQEVLADGARLRELSALAAAGRLTPRVAEQLPLAEAARAHALLEAGGLRGRVVLRP
ncbi:NADP-dependent oxidoreductase [Pseudonocardia lacus]|uniref:NADP-dependent oxidoreductase n=1 Tax=Pseudonocardia lacus TaxID=2835865 RepID=UPI0027E34EA6|nr:NADP-dependent oxidoreductase [Pseudonocardia lacus]